MTKKLLSDMKEITPKRGDFVIFYYAPDPQSMDETELVINTRINPQHAFLTDIQTNKRPSNKWFNSAWVYTLSQTELNKLIGADLFRIREEETNFYITKKHLEAPEKLNNSNTLTLMRGYNGKQYKNISNTHSKTGRKKSVC